MSNDVYTWTVTSSDTLAGVPARMVAEDKLLKAQQAANARGKEADRLRAEVARLRGCIADGEKLAKDVAEAQRQGQQAARNGRGPDLGPPPLGYYIGTPASEARLNILAQQMDKLVAGCADAIVAKNQTTGCDILAVPSSIVSEVRARVREHGLESAVAKAKARTPRVTIVCQGDYLD